MRANAGRALVIDEGTSWSTLCAVRALSAAGWTVAVGCPGGRGLAAASRDTDATFDVPSLAGGVEAFETALVRAVAGSGAEVVFGGGDAEVLALSRMHGRLDAVVPYPDEATVRRSFDKLDLLDAARRAGLGAPDCTEEPPTGPISGPVVVKSRWHWDPWRNDAATRLEATVAGTADEVAAAFAAMRAAGGAPILQEYLEGEHLCMVLLRGRDGGLLGAVHQRIDRRWPVPAGWTVRAHTLAMDPDLRDASVALLEDLGWTGLVELEFIRPADGVPRLIDFNGRFYGSMELAVAAGVDLPTLWAADATGRPVHPSPPARAGVRFQRLGGDLRRALRHPEGALVPAVVDALRYSVGARHSTLSLRDPRPALEYLIGSASGRRRR